MPGRDVDQTFGRYLINGTEAGGVAGSCGAGFTPGAGFGPWLYYQDPGYCQGGAPNIPYSTAASNPGLALTVNNFGVGNIIVKNPSTSGITNPSTYLQKVWAGAGVREQYRAILQGPPELVRRHRAHHGAYLMVDMGGPSSRFHMNFGVRLVNTDLTINGGAANPHPTYYGTASWNGVESNVIPVTTKRNYTDVLPSFNFVLDVTDSQKVRFGAARVVAPQDLFQLGLGNSYNFTRGANNPVTGAARFMFDGGSEGNPYLDPYRASQFLLSYENYFAPGGLAQLATFYKQVDNFVEIENIPTFLNDDFGGHTADVSEPVNAGNGRIYGVELGGQYSFANCRDWLRGFGVAANYTYSQSSSPAADAASRRAGPSRACRATRSPAPCTTRITASRSAAPIPIATRRSTTRWSDRPSRSAPRCIRYSPRPTGSSTRRRATTSTGTSASSSRCRTSPTKPNIRICSGRTSPLPMTTRAAASSSA